MKLSRYFLVFVTLPLLTSCTLQDQWNKEVTVYPVATIEGRGLYPLNRSVYKVFPERQEVIYWMPGVNDIPSRLGNCVVRNRLNWTCEYSDGSGKLTMIDGRFREEPPIRALGSDAKYVSWWRWYLLHIEWVFK